MVWMTPGSYGSDQEKTRWIRKWKTILTGMAICTFIIFIVFNIDAHAAPESGGSDDNISLSFEQGRSEGDWRSIWNFTIFESGSLVGESFNITLSEGITFDDENLTYKPSGHLFGNLIDIDIQTSPQPTITISHDDFEHYREDRFTLSVFVIGEYYPDVQNGSERGDGGSELRQVYQQLTIHRWNQAPVPIAMITHSDEQGNGTWDDWKTVAPMITMKLSTIFLMVRIR
jgi:hypothetical protein